MKQNSTWILAGDAAICGVNLLQLLWVHRDGRLARIPVEPSGLEDKTFLLSRRALKRFLNPDREITADERVEIEASLRSAMASVGWVLSAD